jgi:mRNA-degrading endonuclease RelE of RelBE toxin-antitoxin system
MNLVMTRSARRGMSSMTPKARAALLRRLEAIALRPFGEHANVAALRGAPDMFRLRQGDWRAVYVVDRGSQEVQVLDVAPRGSIYR